MDSFWINKYNYAIIPYSPRHYDSIFPVLGSLPCSSAVVQQIIVFYTLCRTWRITYSVVVKRVCWSWCGQGLCWSYNLVSVMNVGFVCMPPYWSAPLFVCQYRPPCLADTYRLSPLLVLFACWSISKATRLAGLGYPEVLFFQGRLCYRGPVWLFRVIQFIPEIIFTGNLMNLYRENAIDEDSSVAE